MNKHIRKEQWEQKKKKPTVKKMSFKWGREKKIRAGDEFRFRNGFNVPHNGGKVDMVMPGWNSWLLCRKRLIFPARKSVGEIKYEWFWKRQAGWDQGDVCASVWGDCEIATIKMIFLFCFVFDTAVWYSVAWMFWPIVLNSMIKNQIKTKNCCLSRWSYPTPKTK